MRSITKACALLLAAATGPTASVAQVAVTPVLIESGLPASSGTVTVSNPSGRVVHLQVQAVKWSKSESGQDRLEDPTAVVATPPFVDMEANSKYTVRVVRDDTPAGSKEEAYRLLLSDVPDASSIRAGRIKIVVRQSIPVFFAAPDAGPGRLTFSLRGGKGGQSLVVRNDGDSHVRLADIALGSRVVVPGLVGYALGHQTAVFPLKKPVLTAGSQVVVQTQSGPLRASLAR